MNYLLISIFTVLCFKGIPTSCILSCNRINSDSQEQHYIQLFGVIITSCIIYCQLIVEFFTFCLVARSCEMLHRNTHFIFLHLIRNSKNWINPQPHGSLMPICGHHTGGSIKLPHTVCNVYYVTHFWGTTS